MKIPAVVIVFLVSICAVVHADELTYTDFSSARLLDRTSDSLADRSCTVREYGPEELQALGVRDLAGALEMIAGGYVDVGDLFPEKQETFLRLRGQNPTGLRVLIDGVPINDGYRDNADLTRVTLNQVALVRVVTGPSSSRYGPNDTAGTIEVLTKQVEEKFSSAFGTDWGSGDALLYSMWLGDTADFFNYFGAASHDERRTFMLPESFNESPGEAGGERQNSDLRRDSFRGRTGLLFAPPIKIFFGGSYDQDQKGIPKELASDEKGFDRFGQRRRATGQMNLVSKPSRYFELRGTGYITENTAELDSYGTLDRENLFRQAFQRDLRYGGTLGPTIDFGRYSRFRLGGEALHDEVELWSRGNSKDRFLSKTYQVSLEDDIQPLDYLGFSLGASYDLIERGMSGETGNPDPFKLLTPRGGLVLGPFAGAEFHLSAGGKIRAPSLFELFDPVSGDAKLKSERALVYEVGYRHAIKEIVSWTLTGFCNEVRDDIRLLQNTDGTKFRNFSNAGELVTMGGTASIETHPIEGMFASADYTFLSTRFTQKSPEERSPDAEFFAPAHRANLHFGYRFDFGFGGAFGAAYVGPQADPESDTSGDLPSFSYMDARLFYNYRDFMEVYFAGENATDANYETARRYPMPGRFLHGGLKLMF